ncbi:MAG: MmcQ/YjbR family DNA-binding protein [Huintestinicola sp.]
MKNSVISYAQKKYGSSLEHLWERCPDDGILRRRDCGKWFAVFMTVSPKKIGLDSGGTIDIINIKCSPLMTGSLLSQKGYFPAYHMNKNSWVSIILDGTVPEEDILGLLDMSYELADKSSAGRRQRKE